MAAPQGNRNAAKAKVWEGALRAALAQFESTERGIKPGEALRAIANGVVVKALDGDRDAVKEIGDRLDGKPAQAMTLDGSIDVRKKASEMTDDELAEIVLNANAAAQS